MADNSLPPTTSFPATDNVLGRAFGRYRVVAFLGRGGMGTVYQAHDPDLGRDVALKLLPAEMATDADRLKRFEREMRALGRLDHTNVIRVLDVGREGQTPFIVAELAIGSVQDRVRSEPVSWQQATRWLSEACRGLAAVHAAGLIHRDIKPSNILLTNDGTAKLADFGLVRFADAPDGMATGTTPSLLGTPHFMSPEQCRCEPLDERSDLYSLGATYYAMLTGQPPFKADDPLKVLFAHCSTPAPDPRSLVPELPPACVGVLQRALSKAPADRFADANEMLTALTNLVAAPLDTTIQQPATVASSADPSDTRRWIGILLGVILFAAITIPILIIGRRPRETSNDTPPPPPPLGASNPIDSTTWSTTMSAGGPVTALAVHPTEPKHLAWGTTNGLLVASVDGKDRFRFQGTGQVQAIRFALGGRTGHAAFAQNGMVTWNPALGTKDYSKPPTEVGGEISALTSWGPHATIAALSRGTNNQGGFKVWVNGNNGLAAPIEQFHQSVWSMTTSGERLFAGGDDGIVHVWRPDLAETSGQTLRTGLGRITHLAAWSNGERVAISDGARLEIWHVGATKPAAVLLTQDNIGPLIVTPDGTLLLAAVGPRLQAWTLKDNKEGFTRTEHEQAIKALAINVAGTTLYSGSLDGNIRVWDIARWVGKQP